MQSTSKSAYLSVYLSVSLNVNIHIKRINSIRLIQLIIMLLIHIFIKLLHFQSFG